MTTRGWLVSMVIAHFVISVLHGFAHDGGHVGLSALQSSFVYAVILAGPFIGLALSFWKPRIGGLLVALTMAASLVFGVVNHFIIISPDHVSQVVPEWRSLFTASAVLLVLSEAAGVVAGLRMSS